MFLKELFHILLIPAEVEHHADARMQNAIRKGNEPVPFHRIQRRKKYPPPLNVTLQTIGMKHPPIMHTYNRRIVELRNEGTPIIVDLQNRKRTVGNAPLPAHGQRLDDRIHRLRQ